MQESSQLTNLNVLSVFRNSPFHGWFFSLTNKDASTVLCSVVKHTGSGRARKKCRRKHDTQSSVLPYQLSALPLPKCFTTEQSAVEASLFVLLQRI